MKKRTIVLTLCLSTLIGLPLTAKAAQTHEAATSVTSIKKESKDFRPKKKKKKRHGAGCEAYGRFAQEMKR